MLPLSPAILLSAYAHGIFPMAETAATREVFWVDPATRGILPLDRFHIPKSLRRVLRRGQFTVTADRRFEQVMRACAEPSPRRENSWINEPIVQAYTALFHQGYAHSVEVWLGEALVGGLYGVSIGRAFFGESMFSRQSDASKVGLCYLVESLKACGFTLLDTQFTTDHLERFGAIEVPRGIYREQLGQALAGRCRFSLAAPIW